MSPETILSTDSAVVEAKLSQTVEMTDIGPCKKHIKVTVDRPQIDDKFNEKYTELVRSDQPQIRGFRPGKAPRKLIEKQYYDAVAQEVKAEIMMASLEQLAEEQAISPLSPPELDPSAIDIPKEGPFIYEFDIEVRPEFDLPPYKGLVLRRPVHNHTSIEIDRERKRLLDSLGQIVPKPGDDPVVELDDFITADAIIRHGDEVLTELKETRFKVEPQLALNDGVAADFGAKMVGAKVGDHRTVEIRLSQEVRNESLRGQTVSASFEIKDIKVVRQPEMTRELLEDKFGVSTPAAFEEVIRSYLERRLEYLQRQEARRQIIEKLATATTWDLPLDLLRKQAKNTLARKVMEMRNSGMSDAQIEGRRRILEQDSIRSTTVALKEQFVLQKIADVEKLEVAEEDLEAEIDRIASQSNESPRRVRARYEKDELMDALANELLERKALDLILMTATFEDYPLTTEQQTEQAAEVATVAASAAPETEAPALEGEPAAS